MKFVRQLSAVCVCLALIGTTNILNAAKTDTVVLVNGNAVTGAIKSLEFATLSCSTDYGITTSLGYSF